MCYSTFVKVRGKVVEVSSLSTMWVLRPEGKYFNPVSYLINSFIDFFFLRQSLSSPGPGMHYIVHTGIKLWILSMSTC